MKLRKRKIPPTIRQRPAEVGRPSRFSYYSQRSTSLQDVSRQAHHEEIPKRSRITANYLGQRFGALLALLTGILFLVTSLQISAQPRIVILNQPQPFQLHSTETYQTAAQKLLKGSWTNSNKITVNSVGVASKLRAEYPELADVAMTIPLIGQRPVVYAQLTEPQLVLSTQAGQAYVLDENGRVLSTAAEAKSAQLTALPTVSDNSGLEEKVGAVALTHDDVAFIKTVVYQLQQKQIAIGRLVLPAASREFDVYLYNQPYFIKFNLQDGHALQQVGTFLAIRDNLQGKGVIPGQYVDVRLLGRAYYK